LLSSKELLSLLFKVGRVSYYKIAMGKICIKSYRNGKDRQ